MSKKQSMNNFIRKRRRSSSVIAGSPKLDEVAQKMGAFIRGRPDESENIEEAAAIAAAKEGSLEQALGISEEKAAELGLEEGDIAPDGRVYRKEKGK